MLQDICGILLIDSGGSESIAVVKEIFSNKSGTDIEYPKGSYTMSTQQSIKSLILLTILILYNHVHSNELGLSLGINSTFARTFVDSNNISYQKTNIFVPVNIYYSLAIYKYFNLCMALQYIERSRVEKIEKASLNPDGTINIGPGTETLENRLNFISLNILPEFKLHFKKIGLFLQAGLGSDFYINESGTTFGGNVPIAITFIGKRAATGIGGYDSPFTGEISRYIFSFIFGIGVNYNYHNFNIGLLSQVSKTLSNILKTNNGFNFYFLNISNMLQLSINI
jgi:hypothetical protein